MNQLPFERIVVTVPPAHWFHGINHALYQLHRQALVDLGLKIFDVPVDAFVPPDTVRISNLVTELRAFKPQMVLALSHAAYALICRMPAARNGWRSNLFTEVLDLPTICYWDHAPLELADQLLEPHPADPAESQTGALDTLRRVLAHPRMMHWSRDTGQTRIMQELGLALPGQVVQEASPLSLGLFPHAVPVEETAGFIGHLWHGASSYPRPELASLADGALQEWIAADEEPLWYVLDRHISQLSPELRASLALDRQDTYYWHFMHRLIAHRAQTASRLKWLGAAGAPVTFYGNLRTDDPSTPRNLIHRPGEIPFGAPLAAALSRHAVTIDVMNPGFINGISTKPVLAFANGGFVLLNRKQDFVDAYGDAGEAASFRTPDDLRAKLEHLLANPGYRREVGDAIREIIARRYQLKQVLERVLLAAWQGSATAAPTRRSRVIAILDLLPTIRSESHWIGSTVGRSDLKVEVCTPPAAWSYAAAIPVPPVVGAMNQPHLRVSLKVNAGRIGLAPMLDSTGVLFAEHFISPTAQPVTVNLELPQFGASTVIFRNTAETASTATVLEAMLCDRTS